jgi:hypothetical protein
MLAGCTPPRSPEAVGQSLCRNLARDDYDSATRDVHELMTDLQVYSNDEALETFAQWVAAQPCAKRVSIMPWEIYTLPAIREVAFVVDLDGQPRTFVADFRMEPPWIVTFH